VSADGELIAQCTGGMPVFVADSVGMQCAMRRSEITELLVADRSLPGAGDQKKGGPGTERV
jgi:hypothetical protein